MTLANPQTAREVNQDLKDALPEAMGLERLRDRSVLSALIGRSVSFKDEVLARFTASDLGVVRVMLAEDPRLDRFARTFRKAPDMGRPDKRADYLEGNIAHILTESERNRTPLSAQGRQAFTQFIKFYHSYLSPFPDKTETETADSLFELVTNKEDQANNVNRWDVLMKYDDRGNILAASSGQLIPGGTAWNEHTWRLQDPVLRGSRIGSDAYARFQEKFTQEGANRVMIEVDLPPALSTDPAAHDPTNPERRREIWAGEGQSMDPYDRLDFWGNKQGFDLLVAIVKTTDPENGSVAYRAEAVNNSQIALPGNDEGCRTICSMVKSTTDAEKSLSAECRGQALTFLDGQTREGARLSGIRLEDIRGGMPAETFMNTYSRMQATIDADYADKPEYRDAMSDLARAEKILVRVNPLSETGLAAMKARAENERQRQTVA